MAEKYRLDHKVAVITGCASGVGEAAAKMFTEQGARVLAVDVNGAALSAAMEGGHPLEPWRHPL